MSVNFHIRGRRDVTVNKTGATDVQYLEYDTWQTPSNVTHELMASMLPVEAYKAYVMRGSDDEQEAIYDETDLYGDDPIGYKTVNYAKDECTRVDEWIAAVVARGYEIEFYTL